ncbi:MAG: RluA family pseudouridine synthase [Actinobacteria bacterium]|nr:RluA family pseudouridine synthase [Actinomycetota bacterium]
MAHEFTAEPGRLDAVVAAELAVPRADVQRAIEAGRVTVDGHPRPKSFRLAGGERVHAEVAPEGDLPPEPGGVPVRYRDEHLLVVAKPAGVVTHPTENRRTGTLVNRLLGMGVELSSGGGRLRPGIVHRLDVGTSGLMLVACDDRTHVALQAMLQRHEVDRRYLALVRGVTEHDSFTVDAPLDRRGPRVVVHTETGRAAETAFEVRERLRRSTLLEAAPRTGRTHQIRVHLRAIGHPILGDSRYGGNGHDARALGLTRPFLHSYEIGFVHPVTGERLDLEEPLPDDLSNVLAAARRDQRA